MNSTVLFFLIALAIGGLILTPLWRYSRAGLLTMKTCWSGLPRKERAAAACFTAILSLSIAAIAGFVWLRLNDSEPCYIPESIAMLLDGAIESGVLLDEPAAELNEWLNDSVRPRRRELRRSIVDISVELPTAALSKAVTEKNYKIQNSDRLRIYRALAYDRRIKPEFGEYGETLENPSPPEIPESLYEALLTVAEGGILTQQQKIVLKRWSVDRLFEVELHPDAPWPGMMPDEASTLEPSIDSTLGPPEVAPAPEAAPVLPMFDSEQTAPEAPSAPAA